MQLELLTAPLVHAENFTAIVPLLSFWEDCLLFLLVQETASYSNTLLIIWHMVGIHYTFIEMELTQGGKN